jgi:hypothetical protein
MRLTAIAALFTTTIVAASLRALRPGPPGGNPGDAPLTFVAFNMNQEGVPAVLPGAPAKTE